MPAPEAGTVHTPGDDHALLAGAVREAGALAMSFFNRPVKTWEKPGGSPVSEADLVVDKLLNERLTGARPDYGWLSEEQADDPGARLDRRRVWIVDPIDGTRAFLKGEKHFAISASLVEDGAPVSAVVFNPATEEFFDAVRNEGARVNGHPITTGNAHRLEGCRMAANPAMFRHPGWRRPWPPMQVENRNSIAYRLALVASGVFDATVSFNGKQDWDIAAAHLIVTEAGGLVTRHDGKAFVYNQRDPFHISVVAANPALHAALVAQVGDISLPSSKRPAR